MKYVARRNALGRKIAGQWIAGTARSRPEERMMDLNRQVHNNIKLVKNNDVKNKLGVLSKSSSAKGALKR